MSELVFSIGGMCITVLTSTVAIVYHIAKMATKVEYLCASVEKLTVKVDQVNGDIADLQSKVAVHDSNIDLLNS